MTNLSKVLSSIGIFFVFYIVIIVINYIMPPIIDAMEAITSFGFGPVIWFFIAVLWIIGAIVWPGARLYEGLTEPGNDIPKIAEITLACCLFVFGIVLTSKIWSLGVPTTLDSLAEGETFIRIIFWVGMIGVWVGVELITPIYMIVNAYNR